MEPELEELVAYHEAGHAVMAVALGGRIIHVSVEPHDDDGPRRSGESIVQWPEQSKDQWVAAEIQVSLAGPIAEMVYSGFREEIGNVPEFAADWHRVLESLSEVPPQTRAKLLTQLNGAVWGFIENDNAWAAVCAIADLISAHETVEHDQIEEAVAFWLSQ